MNFQEAFFNINSVDLFNTYFFIIEFLNFICLIY
jgi:hypothetical protein